MFYHEATAVSFAITYLPSLPDEFDINNKYTFERGVGGELYVRLVPKAE